GASAGPSHDAHAAARDGDSAAVRRVLAALRDAACDPGLLADRLDLAAAELFPLLTELELSGRITCGADGYALPPRQMRD
ncbi:MAG: hypothetical protein M3169_10605, partial [Candidatus Eremiobacteraeota bacterium]|nr:hypothetical protein [Candidatus Eremiobacteraeota bacterium]